MSVPRRFAFDGRYISDRYHGIGRYAYRLLEAMAAAAPQHTFVVFRGHGADSRFSWKRLASQPNVEIHDGPWPLYWPHEQAIWPVILRKLRTDLFFTPYFVGPLLVSEPTVITVHDLIFDRYPTYMPSPWLRPYYRLLTRLCTCRARRIVTVSLATAADLREFYGTPSEKVDVVPPGADPSFGLSADADQLSGLRLRYQLDSPFMLSVGARRPHKNQGRLVRAFARVAPDISHDLVFVGPADPRFPDEAHQAAAASGLLNGRIRFLDWVPESDLPALYALADLVVMPSLMEGFGFPVLEAMASGTAVLAANASSLPEVVGNSGVLVDPCDESALAEAIRILAEDQTLRQQLAEAGRKRSAAFTWDRAALQMLAIFEQI
jgi:glycosyltransferase involved in cell wall biosynthesis